MKNTTIGVVTPGKQTTNKYSCEGGILVLTTLPFVVFPVDVLGSSHTVHNVNTYWRGYVFCGLGY
jgi:hypothetical protein